MERERERERERRGAGLEGRWKRELDMTFRKKILPPTFVLTSSSRLAVLCPAGPYDAPYVK